MKPVAVFDSGVGGLTVLKALRERFPYQDFIYLGDTARLPYGSKNPKTIRLYLEQCLNFLSQYDPIAFVVACNSASTQVYEPNWEGIPVVNVIDPVIESAIQVTRSGAIGVLGTRATIQSHIFQTKIKSLKASFQVTEQECPLFVPLAEEGWIDDPITNLIAFRYLESIRKAQVDTLILGCTHYPILAHSIKKAVGQDVQLLQSGPVVAKTLESHLSQNEVHSHSGQLKLLVTDISPHLNMWACNLLGLPSDFKIEWVHL
jgi:glutamate racemase